jgi:RNA polymerase sigma factor (sigma-70 family)
MKNINKKSKAKMIHINKMYEDHIGLIKNRAIHYAKQNNSIDYTELFAEANLVFTEIFYTHDIEKGKFSTYLTTCIDNHFKEITKKIQKVQVRESFVSLDELHEEVFNYSSNHANGIIEKIAMEQKIEKLSDKDKEVIEVALTLKNTDSPHAKEINISKNAIKKYLIDLGWRAIDVQRSFNRIEVALF